MKRRMQARRAKRHHQRQRGPKLSPAARERVSDKISVLRHEGERPDTAIATSLNMERKHRLRKGGRYVHVKRKSRSRS